MESVGSAQQTIPVPNYKGPSTIWFMGSNRNLEHASIKFNQDILSILADELIKRKFRIVMGTSDLLNTLWGNIDEYMKKAIVDASVRCSKNDIICNPLVILGSLRSEKGIRNTFYDSINTIPQMAIMIGGATYGRTSEEYKLAVEGNIPVLPMPVSPGLSSSIPCTLTYEFQDDIEKLLSADNKIDKICEVTLRIIERQLAYLNYN